MEKLRITPLSRNPSPHNSYCAGAWTAENSWRFPERTPATVPSLPARPSAARSTPSTTPYRIIRGFIRRVFLMVCCSWRRVCGCGIVRSALRLLWLTGRGWGTQYGGECYRSCTAWRRAYGITGLMSWSSGRTSRISPQKPLYKSPRASSWANQS